MFDMKVSEIITPLYQEANQQFATLLIWDVWLYNAMEMALNDIYMFEWINWRFAIQTEDFEFTNEDDVVKTFTTKYPITRVLAWHRLWDNISRNKFEVVNSKYDVDIWCAASWNLPLHFNPFMKDIRVCKNWWSKLSFTYYWWFDRPTKLDDIIPIPRAFKSAFRCLVLFYILWPQWMYWEQKAWDLWNRWQEILRQLAKDWTWQISNITFKF